MVYVHIDVANGLVGRYQIEHRLATSARLVRMSRHPVTVRPRCR